MESAVKSRGEGGSSSPQKTLQKVSSMKVSCLCSPTTHTGSFRCRHHRTALTRNGASVGSGLSTLADKSDAASSPSSGDDLLKAAS